MACACPHWLAVGALLSKHPRAVGSHLGWDGVVDRGATILAHVCDFLVPGTHAAPSAHCRCLNMARNSANEGICCRMKEDSLLCRIQPSVGAVLRVLDHISPDLTVDGV